jgi:hypothetical protein
LGFFKQNQETNHKYKTIRKSVIIFLAALVAILLLSTAWFANNSQVSADAVQVAADYTDFKLLTKGDRNGLYDTDILQNLFSAITLGQAATGATPSVNWLVSEDSSFGNYSQEDVDFTKADRKDYAIEPGASGELTFYIVPSVSGTQTFNLNLEITPYAATVDAQNTITAAKEVGVSGSKDATDGYARQFVAGHLLFFLESKASDGTIDYTWLQDGDFDVEIQDAEADQEYEYTIFWIWPQVFSQMILNEGDVYLNNRTQILTADLRAEILADMAEQPQLYFYNSLTRLPLTTADDLVQEIADIHKKSPVVGGDDGYQAQSFVDLSSFYNQADQIIGSRVSFLMVSLTAVLGGAEA